MEQIIDTKGYEGKEFGIDVPVLIIFFARPKILSQTFEIIRKVKPSTLLLWQDGPRNDSEKEIRNILDCRKIVENIDWNCTVHRYYHSENLGCDPSTHFSHKWAFSKVDKCIILEDDVLPTLSFFSFCKELLDKYQDDFRIDRICGRNLLGEYNPQNADYFFAKSGNSHGWATWKRVADLWDSEYSYLKDPLALKLLAETKPDKKDHNKWLKRCRNKAATGKPYWEFIVGVETYLNNRLVIYPSKNLISHIGYGENSTHFIDNVNLLSQRDRENIGTPKYDFDFPLRHPQFFVADNDFIKLGRKTYEVNFAKRAFQYFIRRIKMIVSK